LLLSAGACCTALSIDISCPAGAQQQTHSTPLLLSIDRTDRETAGRTDGRTLDRYIDPALHTIRAVSVGLTIRAARKSQNHCEYRDFERMPWLLAIAVILRQNQLS